MTEEEMNDITSGLDFNGSPDKGLVSAQAILEKAITKAIDGGWLLDTGDIEMPRKEGFPHTPDDVFAFYSGDTKRMPYTMMIIFNHDFAKALWGEYKPSEIPIGAPSDGKYPDNLTHRGLRKWQYHLQQMVIADDSIAYLGENL